MSKYLGAVKLIGATKHRAVPDPSLVLYRDRPQAPINGVGRLPAAMTINSVTEYPVFRYTAGGGLVDAADWRPWGYGENLDIVAVATPPTLLAGSPGLGPMDQSVLFNASDYFQANNASFADIGTQDIVVELVMKFTGVTFRRPLSKQDTSGWEVYSSATALQVRLDTGPVQLNPPTANIAHLIGCWVYFIGFGDRSGSWQWYVDGDASGAPTVISTASATLTSASAFTVGATPTGIQNLSTNLAYAAMWLGDAWLDTHLQATIAEQRASLFWGWRPQQARGTAVPTVRTRASAAYLDKVDVGGRKIYLLGQNVPRAVSRLDANGALLKGLLSEVQITNLAKNSEDMTTGWGTTRTSITNTSTTSLPNGITTSNDVIHEDATAATTHYVNTAAIDFASGTKYVVSVWLKAINRNFARLDINNNGTDTRIDVDLSTGVIGTTANVTESGIEKWRNGWYRIWFSWTHGATESRGILIYVGEADNDVSFDGLNQDSIYCWGVQVEAGVDYPTSYMPTAAAAVIREEDVLRYAGADGNLGGVGSNKRGQINLRVLCENYNATLAKRLVTLSDGGAAADQLYLRSTASDVLNAQSAASGGSAGSWVGTSDVIDGDIHSVEFPYVTNNFGPGRVDGAAESVADADCLMPDDLDRVDVGVSESGVTQPNCVLADIEFSPHESRN